MPIVVSNFAAQWDMGAFRGVRVISRMTDSLFIPQQLAP
jgi:hypothetical protein